MRANRSRRVTVQCFQQQAAAPVGTGGHRWRLKLTQACMPYDGQSKRCMLLLHSMDTTCTHWGVDTVQQLL